MSLLRIPRAVYDNFRKHGEETYPFECCGVLIGQAYENGWEVESAVRVGNSCTETAHNRYVIPPFELVKVEREAAQKGLSIAGFYHSHPDHPAEWSPTDFEEAHWLGCSYVITEVSLGSAEITNFFRLEGTCEEDKRFEREGVQITE